MVRFDSKTKHLILARSAMLDGQSMVGHETIVDLSSLDEGSRQVVIATAKVVMAYANGNRVDLKPKPVKDGKGQETQGISPVESLMALVGRHFPVKGNQPEDTGGVPKAAE